MGRSEQEEGSETPVTVRRDDVWLPRLVKWVWQCIERREGGGGPSRDAQLRRSTCFQQSTGSPTNYRQALSIHRLSTMPQSKTAFQSTWAFVAMQR